MIKKCPFCGGDPHIRTKELRYYGRNGYGDKKVRQAVYVYCGKCHARGPSVTETVVLTAEKRFAIPTDMFEKAFDYWELRANMS